jgi:predicted esterase
MTLHLREPLGSMSVTKPAPKISAIPVPFYYAPSEDGTDENLLILLHGLGTRKEFVGTLPSDTRHLCYTGDTHIPFSKLGRQLNLPQTAVLALRAPEQ